MSTFNERYRARRKALKSHLCVGLDPVPERLPAGYQGINGILRFHEEIVEATADLTVAYKPNLAFFEALGPEGWTLFEKTIETIRKKAPGALIIADAKRGDIGNTARMYAKTFFESYDCDSMTVNPFMGPDTVEPYLEYKDKGIIVLCLTSNDGSETFLASTENPLYKKVAIEMNHFNKQSGNIWLVVGATKNPERVREIRTLAPDLPFLVPGVGAQGGSAKDVFDQAGQDIIINASRSIIYSEEEGKTVAERSRKAAEKLVNDLRNHFE